MNLVRIRFEMDFYSAEPLMSDWITKLKQDANEARERQARDRDWQLRCEEIVRAKGPAIWDTAVTKIQADAAELCKAFPDDPSKQLEVTGAIKIVRPGNPHVSLTAQWVPEILGVGVRVYSQWSNSPEAAKTDKQQITFSATTEGDVLMSVGANRHLSVADLSEYLLKMVLDF